MFSLATWLRGYLPDRKGPPDIMNRCAECAEREAAANDRKQHGRLHALDLLLVDVKLVKRVVTRPTRYVRNPTLKQRTIAILARSSP